MRDIIINLILIIFALGILRTKINWGTWRWILLFAVTYQSIFDTIETFTPIDLILFQILSIISVFAVLVGFFYFLKEVLSNKK